MNNLAEELRRLNAARTPGEWMTDGDKVVEGVDDDDELGYRPDICEVIHGTAADAEFIAYCANNASQIIEQLERVERLEAENAKLRRVAEAAKGMFDGEPCEHKTLRAALAELEGR